MCGWGYHGGHRVSTVGKEKHLMRLGTNASQVRSAPLRVTAACVRVAAFAMLWLGAPSYGQVPESVWAAIDGNPSYFSRDGALATDGLSVWRTSDWTRLHTLPRDRSIQSTLAGFLGEDDLLLYLSPDSLDYRRFSDGALVQSYPSGLGSPYVSAMAISPDRTLFAAGTNQGEVKVYRLADGANLWSAQAGHSARVIYALAFSPDSRLLTFTDLHTVIYDALDGAHHSAILRHARRLTFSPDGTLLALGNGQWMYVHRVDTGAAVAQWRFDHTSLQFAPTGLALVSAGSPGELNWWDPLTGQRLRGVKVGTILWQPHFQYTPDGKYFLTSSDERQRRVWRDSDLSVVRELSPVSGHCGAPLSRDGALVAGCTSNQVVLLSAADGAELHRLRVAGSGPGVVRFSPDGQFVATSTNGFGVMLWRVSDGQYLQSVAGMSYGTFAFSPDSQYLATTICTGHDCYLGIANVYRLSDFALVAQLTGHGKVIHALAFSPDSRELVSLSYDRLAIVWSIPEGVAVRQMQATSSYYTTAAWSPDGALLVTARRGATGVPDSVELWNPADLSPAGSMTGHGGRIGGLSFTPDGRHLAAKVQRDSMIPLSSDAILFWRIADGEVALTYLDEVSSAGTPLSFSDDGLRYSYGFAYGAGGGVVVARNPFGHLLADLNCDGRVSFDDIEPFVAALVAEAAYYEMQPHCRWESADVDRDGVVGFADVDAFVACLIAQGCGTAAQ
jgi:WD40 repeat protein